LRTLNVSNKFIIGEAAAQFAQALVENERMEMFCGIPLRGLRQGTLTELDLAGNGIGVPGALLISKLLPSALSLHTLNLEGE